MTTPSGLGMTPYGIGSSAIGQIAESLAAVELLRRGHKVFVPLVDDDGVDMLVDYRFRVQVKSSATKRRLETAPSPDGRYVYEAFSWAKIRPAKVDVFILHASDDGRDRWWIVPSSMIVAEKTIVTLYPGAKRGRARTLLAQENAWDVFGR